MNRLAYYFLIIVALVSCKKDSKIAEDIAQIDIDLTVERFDTFFIGPTAEDLSTLKETYPFMFSKTFLDSDWDARRQDTLQQELHAEVRRTFQNFDDTDIELLFKHLKHHYKTFITPRVITVTSDVDYRNKVIVTDSITLIALDTYLGEDHKFYGGIQLYLRQNFKEDMIVSDLAEAYAEKNIYQKNQKTFLDNMIYFGKILYFKDTMIPFVSDEIKIGYTTDQLHWAIANESNIWQYFVERELLYSTDPKLASRFINPGPFSKFNLEFDSESPGRLGQYIGWKIVRAYMKNNNTTLDEMLLLNAEDIFNNSRFKPQK